MPESIYKIDLDERSESHYFLPRPPLYEALNYLTSMAHEYTRSTYYVERYQTDAYMLHYTLSGEGRFIYDGHSCTLKPGTLLFAYMGVHNILYPLSEDFEYCCFHGNGVQMKTVYSHVTEDGSRITVPYPEEGILPLFERLREYLIPPVNFFEISKELSCFLTDILSYTQDKKQTMSPLAHEVYKAIVSNNTSVEQIARSLHFSPVYLEKHFKKETGDSIRSLIVKHKLEQAQHLLLTTTLPISDIAAHVGYADTVGLIHLFRRYLDCTPLEFRKRKKRTTIPADTSAVENSLKKE